MTIDAILRHIDENAARAFVQAARRIIDALMIEAARVRQTQTPPPRDYRAAGLPREAPPGGWLGDDELRSTLQKMNEAIAVEKWAEGFAAAMKLLLLVRP